MLKITKLVIEKNIRDKCNKCDINSIQKNC